MRDRQNPQHSAHYDAQGNIIIPGTSQPTKNVQMRNISRIHRNKDSLRQQHFIAPKHRVQTPISVTMSTRSLLGNALEEGRNQMHATKKGIYEVFHSFIEHIQSLLTSLMSGILKLPSLLLSPLTPPTFFRTTAHTPRWKIFIGDSLRFGGTFAAIFTTLFVIVNYQSFWGIARAQLAIGRDIARESSLTRLSKGIFGAHATGALLSKVQQSTNLHRLLPKVGPIEDRIIIPKLNINVPVVRPTIDALLKENWKQFEEDIQTALREGVVHYPGSARPGQPGNFFVTGHSSYYPWDSGSYKDVFARLQELEIGDTYSVYYGGDLYVYRIISKREVKPTDVSVLDQPTRQRLASLMTCVPIGTTLRRLILTAEEINPENGRVITNANQRNTSEKNSLPDISVLPI